MSLSVGYMEKVKSLEYSDKIPTAQQKKIDRVSDTIFGEDVINIMVPAPPLNNSIKVVNELEILKDLPKNDSLVKRYDDISNVFLILCSDLGVSFPVDKIKQLIDDSSSVILFYKWLFNRPRPMQLDEFYKVGLGEGVNFISMHTPSYPSGHSTQGYLIADYLSDLYPDHKRDFFLLAHDISYSRQVARAHYPSDSLVGIELGKTLFSMLGKND